MLQVLTPAEIAEHEARDKAMFDALSTADKVAFGDGSQGT